MGELSFEWDRRKAAANLKKHGVSFEEAKSTFYDEHAVEFFDPDHSAHEDRFLLLGLSSGLRTLVVSHYFRESELVIRIISARKATQAEEDDYWSRRT